MQALFGCMDIVDVRSHADGIQTRQLCKQKPAFESRVDGHHERVIAVLFAVCLHRTLADRRLCAVLPARILAVSCYGCSEQLRDGDNLLAERLLLGFEKASYRNGDLRLGSVRTDDSDVVRSLHEPFQSAHRLHAERKQGEKLEKRLLGFFGERCGCGAGSGFGQCGTGSCSGGCGCRAGCCRGSLDCGRCAGNFLNRYFQSVLFACERCLELLLDCRDIRRGTGRNKRRCLRRNHVILGAAGDRNKADILRFLEFSDNAREEQNRVRAVLLDFRPGVTALKAGDGDGVAFAGEALAAKRQVKAKRRTACAADDECALLFRIEVQKAASADV